MKETTITDSLALESEMGELAEYDFGAGPEKAHRHRNPDGSEGGWCDDSAVIESGVYVHPRAVVLQNAWIGAGARIFDKARINRCARVGLGVAIGEGTIVGEKSSIGTYSCIGAFVVVLGSVGNYSLVGADTIIKRTVCIVDYCYVGAGVRFSGCGSVLSYTSIPSGSEVVWENGTMALRKQW